MIRSTPLNLFSYAALLSLAMATAGCATAEPVVRLSPVGDDVTWSNGRGVLIKESDGLHVAMAYERNLGKRLAFWVEVVNRSDQTVLLEPNRAVCAFCSDIPTDAYFVNRMCPRRVLAIDPEAEALAVELEQARTNAELQNTESWMTGLLVLSVVTDVMAATSGKRHDNSSLLLLNGLHHTNAAQDRASMHYGSTLDFWQRAPLRRTTLRPGETASGLLVVEGQPHVPIVLNTLKVGAKWFQFAFAQTTHDPRPRPGRDSGATGISRYF